jgi:hypothetical protein
MQRTLAPEQLHRHFSGNQLSPREQACTGHFSQLQEVLFHCQPWTHSPTKGQEGTDRPQRQVLLSRRTVPAGQEGQTQLQVSVSHLFKVMQYPLHLQEQLTLS